MVKSLNMCQYYLCVFAKCIVLLFLTANVVSWESEDLELFDIVEEVNKNFYDVMGVSQVKVANGLWSKRRQTQTIPTVLVTPI